MSGFHFEKPLLHTSAETTTMAGMLQNLKKKLTYRYHMLCLSVVLGMCKGF